MTYFMGHIAAIMTLTDVHVNYQLFFSYYRLFKNTSFPLLNNDTSHKKGLSGMVTKKTEF